MQLIIQTRSGTDDDPTNHFIFDELSRLLKVDRPTYEDAPSIAFAINEGSPGFQACRGEDTENWTPWSIAYVESGDEVRSADGGTFFQFRFEIATQQPFAFGVLDSVAFEVSPLLADSVLAEVSLAGPLAAPQVPLGVDTTFVYDIRTVFATQGRVGFDAIELDVPPGARFLDLEIDEVPAQEGVDFSFIATPNKFSFTFPRIFVEDASFRVRYRSAIYQASLFLEGQLINRDPQAALLPQSIEAGDARPEVASNSIQVVASGAELSVLGALRLSSPVLTPNGDGANDIVVAAFDLFGVNGAQTTMKVRDLAGRRVATLLSATSQAGSYAPIWDGTGADGELVPPGLYLVQIEVEIDLGVVTQTHAVAVTY